MLKNWPGNAGDGRDTGSVPGLGRSPRVGNGNLLQCSFLENHGQRSQVGYSPWGYKESYTTEYTAAPVESYIIKCSGITLSNRTFSHDGNILDSHCSVQ